MEGLPALGYCPTCRDMMITKDGVPTCLNCVPSSRPKHIVKPPPVTDIPNEGEFKKYVKGTAEVTFQPKPVVPVVTGTAKDALEIMRHLELPSTEKEFKQIKKIIKQLEKLVGEDNGN